MSNWGIGCTLLASSLIGILMMIGALWRRRESDGVAFFVLLSASNALWCICHGLFYLVANETAALFFHELRFVFICMSSLQTYLFVLKAFRHRNLSPKLLAGLFSLPFLTLLALLTNPWLGLMRTRLSIIVVGGLRTVDYAFGPWFWMHCAVCFLALFLSLRLLVQQYLRLPKNYRTPVVIMLAGVLLTILSSVASILNLIPLMLDIAPLVVEVSLIFFYFALFSPHSLDMLFTSREIIFENASFGIFVLDNDGRVLDYNRLGLAMLERLGFGSPRDRIFDKVIERWVELGDGRFFEDDRTIVTVSENGVDAHYQMVRTDIVDKRSKAIGAYVEIKNITPIMSLIHRLQETAYFDHLTGLYNRHSFARLSAEMDDERYLPLGVIVGDVNELKRINDSYGHLMGDTLLQRVTEALRDGSPNKSVWARLGGDEFAGIIPKTSERELQAIVADIESRCAAWREPQLAGTGIAMSYAVRENLTESISAMLHKADLSMYAAKRDRRRSH